MMKHISQKHPKPKLHHVDDARHAQELAEKAPTGDTCKICGKPIVWIGSKPCDPLIQEFVAADQQNYVGRVDHRTTCPQQWNGKPETGIEASQPG